MSDAMQTMGKHTLADFEAVEGLLLRADNRVDCPVQHWFGPGVYVRQTTMPAGSVVIGHQHKTAHLNVVMKGRAVVLVDGVRREVKAPCVIPSGAGTRKIALILEELVWASVHATEETDIDKLEELLIEKSPTFLEHSRREAEQLISETGGTE